MKRIVVDTDQGPELAFFPDDTPQSTIDAVLARDFGVGGTPVDNGPYPTTPPGDGGYLLPREVPVQSQHATPPMVSALEPPPVGTQPADQQGIAQDISFSSPSRPLGISTTAGQPGAPYSAPAGFPQATQSGEVMVPIRPGSIFSASPMEKQTWADNRMLGPATTQEADALLARGEGPVLNPAPGADDAPPDNLDVATASFKEAGKRFEAAAVGAMQFMNEWGRRLPQASGSEWSTPGVLGSEQRRLARAYERIQAEITEQRPEGMTPAQAHLYNLSLNVVNMLPTLGLGLFTGPVVGLAPLAAQSFGEKYAQDRMEGKSEKEAAIGASVYGLAETLPEVLPLHMFTSKGFPAVVRFLGGALSESPSEMITELAEGLFDEARNNPDAPLGQTIKKLAPRIAQAGLQGAELGLVLGAAGHVTNRALGRGPKKPYRYMDPREVESASSPEARRFYAGRKIVEANNAERDWQKFLDATAEMDAESLNTFIRDIDIGARAEVLANWNQARKGSAIPTPEPKGLRGVAEVPAWARNRPELAARLADVREGLTDEEVAAQEDEDRAAWMDQVLAQQDQGPRRPPPPPPGGGPMSPEDVRRDELDALGEGLAESADQALAGGKSTQMDAPPSESPETSARAAGVPPQATSAPSPGSNAASGQKSPATASLVSTRTGEAPATFREFAEALGHDWDGPVSRAGTPENKDALAKWKSAKVDERTGEPRPDHGMVPAGGEPQESIGQTRELPAGTIQGGAEEIGDLIDAVLSGEVKGDEKRAVYFGDEQRDLPIGDVRGYRHVVDSFSVRHILKQHGRQGDEASRGQSAITRSDLLRIPEIVMKPDTVEAIGADKRGAPLVRYARRYNGTTYFVEEVRRGRGELAAKTMWKSATRGDATETGSPPLTSEAIGRDLPHGKESVARPDGAGKPTVEPTDTPETTVTGSSPRFKPGDYVWIESRGDIVQAKVRSHSSAYDGDQEHYSLGIDRGMIGEVTRRKPEAVWGSEEEARIGQATQRHSELQSTGGTTHEGTAKGPLDTLHIGHVAPKEKPTGPAPDTSRATETLPVGARVANVKNGKVGVVKGHTPKSVRVLWDGETKPGNYVASMLVPTPDEGSSTAGRAETNREAERLVDRADTTAPSPQEHPVSKRGSASPTSASESLADAIKGRIEEGTAFDWRGLFALADHHFGGTQADGAYTVKDAYDALELGVNRYIADHPARFDPSLKNDTISAVGTIGDLGKIIGNIPTQTKRTAETDEFQQFSTPPTLAFAVGWVANIRTNDTVLEPSAGVGGIAVFAKNAGARVFVNELSHRRAALLRELGFDRVFTENAEHINDILPADVQPSVVVMNPPFSSTSGRLQGTRNTQNATKHLEQALARLSTNGRLVAILGSGMAEGRPQFSKFWSKIKSRYNVRANVVVNGDAYRKYGTTFDNIVVVIDKTGPTPHDSTLTGRVERVSDLVNLLKEVRDGRVPAGERASALPAGEGAPAPDEGGGERQLPVPVATDRLGNQDGPTGGTAGRDSGIYVRYDAGQPMGGTPESRARVVPGDGTGAVGGGGRGVGGASGVDSSEPRGGPALRVERKHAGARSGVRGTSDQDNPRDGIPAPGSRGSDEDQQAAAEEGRQTEVAAPPKKPATHRPKPEISGSVYEPYTPAKLSIPGAKPHPGPLVESAPMAAVEPVAASYSPNLPEATITSGALSLAQLEAITYAGQAHQDLLPNGARRGFFIGDGTGVGKGREIAGIILDNWRQGRRKAVWISQNFGLAKDAVRDLKGVGFERPPLLRQDKVKVANDITAESGILFTGYNTLGKTKRRVDQIVKWLGEDFDGVIAFDEAHKMGNAIPKEGNRGKDKVSNRALAGMQLQKRLPLARIVYVSATGATEVSNLAYAERLGLWGEGTPFSDKKQFVSRVEQGGVAAMETVAQNLKAMGMYTARSLSYDDVVYDRLTHKLTQDQREMYDDLAKMWQVVLANIDAALESTGAVDGTGKVIDRNAKSNALSAFWGANQRFWNQILTAAQMPTLINSIRKDLAAGHAVVLQIVNTNEAGTNRKLGQMQEGDSLEDLDLTPRDVLGQYLENSFPTAVIEEYTTEDGIIDTRVVKDANGNPVQSQEALALREEMLTRLGALKAVPDNPLDLIINTFGVDNVAEITGRSQRVIDARDEHGRLRRMRQKWSKTKGDADVDRFMNDEKRILVFSKAGGTGRSYHADLAAKNQRLRMHYLVQAGWSADDAVQGLGRAHRTNQAQAPHITLVETDIPGHKRFISTIARRLSQLGALTRGDRKSGSQGIFSERDNLENEYAAAAVRQVITQIADNGVEGIDLATLETELGLSLSDEYGGLNESSIKNLNVPKFLNRLLSMTLDMQDKVFGVFSERMDALVEAAERDGTIDQGMETVKAKRADIVSETTVYTDPRTGADTQLIELNLVRDAKRLPWEQVVTHAEARGIYRNKRSGAVWAHVATRMNTEDSGRVQEIAFLANPRDNTNRVDPLDLQDPKKWEKLPAAQAEQAWQQAYEQAPKEVEQTQHLLTGIILPIWDRIAGRTRIMRVQTSDGRVLLGRQMNGRDLEITMRNLGLDVTGHKTGPQVSNADAIERVIDQGEQLTISNGWTVARRRVSGDDRVEIIGPDHRDTALLQNQGAIVERINWKTRVFIPTGEDMMPVFERIMQGKTIVDVVGGDHTVYGAAGLVGHTTKTPVAGHAAGLTPTYPRTTSPHEMIEKTAALFGIKVGYGKYRQRARGIFKTHEKVIRLDRKGNVETFWHEFGHWLKDRVKPTITDEVKQFVDAPPGKRVDEGFSEFVRLFVTQPAVAEQMAPDFFGSFSDAAQDITITPRGGKPVNLGKALADARELWAGYEAAPSVAKIGSMVRSGSGKPKNRLWTWGKVQAAIWDELDPILRVDRAVAERTGRPLRASKAPGVLAWGARGWVGRAQLMLDRGTFRLTEDGYEQTGEPLGAILGDLDKIEGAPSTLAQRVGNELFGTKGTVLEPAELLDVYLIANRAVKDPRILAGFEGVLVEGDFQQAVHELEEQYDPIAKRLYEYSDRVLDYLVDSGRVSEQTAQSIRERNLSYAPLYRVFDSSESFAHGLSKNKFGNVPNPVKRLKGSSREIWSPTESLVYNTLAFVNAAERNRVGEALINIAENVADLGDLVEKLPFRSKAAKVSTREAFAQLRRDFREIESNSGSQVAGAFAQAIDEMMGHQDLIESLASDPNLGAADWETALEEAGLSMDDVFQIRDTIVAFRPNRKAGPNEAIFYRRGEPYLVEMDPELYDAVMAVGGDTMGGLWKILSLPAKIRRTGATTNLRFPLRNIEKDAVTAFLGSDYGVNSMHSVAKDAEKLLAHAFGVDTKAFRRWVDHAKPVLEVVPAPFWDTVQGVYHRIKRDEVWAQYMASGAAHAAMVSLDREYLGDTVKAIQNRSRLKRARQRLGKSPIAWLQMFSEALEEANRIPAFQRALEANGGDLDALLAGGVEGRDVTLDFSRTGSNQAVKTMRLLTAFWGAKMQGLDKTRRLLSDPKTARRTLLRAFFAYTVPSMLIAFKYGDDDAYKDAPWWAKTYGWVIPIRGDDGELIVRLWVPKGFTLGTLFGSLPEMIIANLRERDPQAFAEARDSIINDLSPLELPSGWELPGELRSNYSKFQDRAIVPRALEGVEPVEQFGPYTTETAKLIARGMERVGLGKYASPIKIGYAVGSLAGGLGRETLRAADAVMDRLGVTDAPPNPAGSAADLPGLGAFVLRYPAHGRAVERFYRQMEQARRTRATAIKQAGDANPAFAVARNLGAARVSRGAQLRVMDAASKRLARLRALMRYVRAQRGKRWETSQGRQRKKALLDGLAFLSSNVARSALGEAEVPIPKRLQAELENGVGQGE